MNKSAVLAGHAGWLDRRGPISFQIALSTFGILALELALIRWTSVQIRVFAYFNNVVLIGAFLGMGLGVALGRRHPRLVHLTLPLLALLAVPLTFSQQLQIMNMPFPDPSIALWGAERAGHGAGQMVKSLAVFLGLFAGMVSVFLFAGAAVGQLFSRLPALRAYSADLLGSLAGVAVFTLATFLGASPPVWLLLGAAAFLWLSLSVLSIVSFVAILVLGWVSVGDAVFSPYNRIDLHREGSQITLNVNRDFHQFMHDLSERRLADPALTPEKRTKLRQTRAVYDLPFSINKLRRRALIVGAGSGNDVQAALRNGYRQVLSIDIDREIIELGAKLHPERPYADRRVVPVVNDARAFFAQYRGAPFDVVCFGLLDSHAMFSSMSSLRLDNFVYTEEGIRAAWGHVGPGGHLTISFSVFSGPWIFHRIYWTIKKAVGKEPLAIYHGLHYGATFVVVRAPAMMRLAPMSTFPRMAPMIKEEHTQTTSDDWPFLYLRPGSFPWGYLLLLAVIVAGAAVSVPFAFGRTAVTKDFDPVLFLMGGAFLLIETRGVTSLSLLFGSTWVVNSSVFFGVLLMVLAANLFVMQRRGAVNPRPWFAALLLSVTFLALFDLSLLNQLPLVLRGILGGLISALPIGIAGVIVSTLLARAKSPAASLGSNILGSVVGGCCEYLSMFVGLRALVLLAVCLYLLAFLFFLRKRAATAAVDHV